MGRAGWKLGWIGSVCVAACGSVDSPDPRWLEPGLHGSGLTKGQPGALNGDLDYCNDPANRCAIGEGDCDAETDCAIGLVCGYDNGPQFGMGNSWDVCVPPSCRNGVQDANESAIDCGGTSSCGQCLVCPVYPNVHASHCSTLCPCPTEEGDCDADEECGVGLRCTPHTGARFGMPADHDVCLPAHCSNGILDGDETSIDGGGSCGNVVVCPPNGQADSCSIACPCAAGMGDCDTDSNCQSGLVCGRVLGGQFGIKAELDVCVAPHCANGVTDSGELGIDCGGECGSCMTTPESPTCTLASTWETVGEEWLVDEIAGDSEGRLYATVHYYDGVSYRWRVGRSVDQGETWPYIDYWPGLGGNAVTHDATVDGDGYAYVQGEADDASNRYIVIRKLSGGIGWTTVNTFGSAPIPEMGAPSYVGGIAASPTTSGLVVSAVTTLDDHWLVRRTTDAGATWTTVDDLAHAGATDIAFASNGDIYVVGSSSGQWLVRRSVNGGTTWQTVDYSAFASGSSDHGCLNGGAASAVAASSTGDVFVAGSCFQGDPESLPWTYWEVRKSSTGSAGTWTSVDTFVDSGVETASPRDITVGFNGTIHVIGSGAEQQWLVRTSEDDGATWSIDDAPDTTSDPAVPEKLSSGSGSLYATGSIGDVTVVRRRLCE